MNSAMDYLDINLGIDEKNLYLNQEVNLNIDIRNKSNYTIENTLFRLILNSEVLQILDDKFSVCINDFINLRNIEPGFKISLKVPIKVSKIPKDLYENIFCYINFHIIQQDQIQDFTYKSDELKINFINQIDTNSFIYEIDKFSGFIDDTITHKLTIRNDTKREFLDLKLSNNFSDKVNFVENSLVIDKIYRVEENISSQLKLGDLEENEEIIITFKTKLIYKENIEDMKFYLYYKSDKNTITQESNSNSFEIFYPEFDEVNFNKYQSKSFLKLYDTLDITIEALNTGTSDAIDVLIKDFLPSGLEFVESSLYLNDERVDSNITNEGVKLECVKFNEKIIIRYKAKAIDICTSEKVNAYISYTSNNKSIKFNTYSKETETTVIGARIGNDNISIDLSNDTAQIGDKVTYTINIKNTGNIDCESLKLEVPTNDAIAFIEKSIRIDDEECEEYKDLNIFDGLILSRIRTNQVIKISYQVEIIDFPKPNPISDRAILEYSYIFENEVEKNIIYSTRSKLYVNNPILIVVDRNALNKQSETDIFNKMCFKGENIHFNLEIQNKGNVGIEGLCLKLNLLKKLEICEDSIKVNNKSYTKIDDKFLHLPNLNVSQKLYLDFEVKYIPSKENNLEVPISLEYRFRDLKTQNTCNKVKKIKENICIIDPNIEVNKFISDKDIEVDREFTKNINVNNTGNILLKDIVLDINESEFLNKCQKVMFVNGNYIENAEKIYINELDVNESANIAIRYNVEDLTSYENIIPESNVVATYSLSSDKPPITIKKKSNKLNINIKNYSLDISGKTNNELIMMNSINKYIFNIINDGNVDCEDVKIKIEIPKEISYVENSLCVNGKSIGKSSLLSHIDIESLQFNQLKNISFDFKVNNLPYKNQLKIMAIADCKYKNEENIVTKTFQSKETILNVENIDIDIVKVASSETVQKNDILQIQTIINNIGSVNVKDIYLIDNQNKNLVFVKDSVFIDGENIKEIDSTKGIQLPYLEVGKNILITYQYQYVPTISSNKVVHFSNISYCYQIKNRPEERITTKSNVLYLEGTLSTFKEFGIENEYELRDYEPDIGDIVNVSTNAKVEEYYEISTMRNKSIENEESTGKKVIIKGITMARIEYLTDGENSSLYMLERSQPFSIFINLPNDYDGEEIYFKPKCDNVFYKSLGKRGLFTSSLISIEGSF